MEYNLDIYEAIKAVLNGKKVKTELMEKGVYLFLKQNVIRHCVPGTEKHPRVARLGEFLNDKFAILEEPKFSLSDKMRYDTPGSGCVPEEVIPVKDLVLVLKELKNMIFYSLGSTALFSKKVDNLLGEKLVKKLGECE